MKWDAIYRAEVAPVLTNFSSGPPVWVYAIIGVVAAGGLALIIWAPLKIKMAGFVLLFFCGFIGFMVFRSASNASRKVAEFRRCTVLQKLEEKRVVKDSRGIMVPEVSYRVEAQCSLKGRFDETGLLDQSPIEGTAVFGIGKSIYDGIAPGETITGVILPTASDYFHFLVTPDGQSIH